MLANVVPSCQEPGVWLIFCQCCELGTARSRIMAEVRQHELVIRPLRHGERHQVRLGAAFVEAMPQCEPFKVKCACCEGAARLTLAQVQDGFLQIRRRWYEQGHLVLLHWQQLQELLASTPTVEYHS